MNVCNPLRFSIRKREGVGGITQINVLCGNICRADCRTFVPLFAVLPLCCSPIFWGHGQLWDHGGAELRAPGGAVRLWGCRVTPRTSRACSPLCAVQCVRTVQQQNLNLLGRTSPSRSTGSHQEDYCISMPDGPPAMKYCHFMCRGSCHSLQPAYISLNSGKLCMAN